MNTVEMLHIFVLCVSYFTRISFSLPDGLHPTPPMGWSSWNTFFGPGSEEQLIAQVNKMIHRTGFICSATFLT